MTHIFLKTPCTGVALRKAEHYRLVAAFVACLSNCTTSASSEPVRSANKDAAALMVDSSERDARVASKKPALANEDSAALKVDNGERDARVASKKPALANEDPAKIDWEVYRQW